MLIRAGYGPFRVFYFNFVTWTSTELGDIIPRSKKFMAVTIIHIAVDLALTTTAIEMAADTLKKLQYFRQKIESVGKMAIGFGGK
ncbi:Ion channel, partial [Trichostrongylus colubriformis]